MSKNLFTKKAESPGGDVQDAQQGRLQLRWGKVVEIAPDFSQARVESDENDQIVTFWLSILYPKTLHDKYYWHIDIDETVWFLVDEQAEEGVILGGFYCPDAEPHEPDIDETEIRWRDCSFVRYHKADHELVIDIKGKIIIRASEGIEIESHGDLTLKGESIALESDSIPTANGVEIAGMGSVDTDKDKLVKNGIKPGGFSPDPEEPCWEGPTEELEGDLRRLQGYTPAGWGNGGGE